MRLIYAILLTLAPPFLGLSAFYLQIYPYSFEELHYTIMRQLWYMNHYWVLISLVINYVLLSRLSKRAKSEAKIIVLKKGP